MIILSIRISIHLPFHYLTEPWRFSESQEHSRHAEAAEPWVAGTIFHHLKNAEPWATQIQWRKYGSCLINMICQDQRSLLSDPLLNLKNWHAGPWTWARLGQKIWPAWQCRRCLSQWERDEDELHLYLSLSLAPSGARRMYGTNFRPVQRLGAATTTISRSRLGCQWRNRGG